MWLCGSMKPGSTVRPPASITRMPGRRKAATSWSRPTATILPAWIAMADRVREVGVSRPSIVSTFALVTSRSTESSLSRQTAAREAAPEARVEEVAQPVAEQVQPHDHDGDAAAGEEHEPGRGLDEVAPLRDHGAPARHRWRGAGAEEAQDGLGQHGDREGERGQHEQRREDVREHVPGDEAPVRDAEGARGLDVG